MWFNIYHIFGEGGGANWPAAYNWIVITSCNDSKCFISPTFTKKNGKVVCKFSWWALTSVILAMISCGFAIETREDCCSGEGQGKEERLEESCKQTLRAL